MLVDAEAIPELMLDEIGRRAGSAEKKLPAWLWASPDAAAKDEARCRADELIDRLERQGRDCILVSHPRMIELLMDRLRVRGYVAQRTGFGRVRPWEQMLLSRRDEHCGFCNHNCLLLQVSIQETQLVSFLQSIFLKKTLKQSRNIHVRLLRKCMSLDL